MTPVHVCLLPLLLLQASQCPSWWSRSVRSCSTWLMSCTGEEGRKVVGDD
jgi:hypothetical protein